MRTWSRPALVCGVILLFVVAAIPVNLIHRYLMPLHPLAYYAGWALTIVAVLRLVRFDEKWNAAG